MYNALEYAVELRLLNRNPVKAIKWKAPKTTQEIDRGCVVNHVQAPGLLILSTGDGVMQGNYVKLAHLRASELRKRAIRL